MSSFLVSDEHVTTLVNAAREFARYGPFTYYYGNPSRRVTVGNHADAQTLGTLLRETNIAGQLARYGDDDGAPAYVHPHRPYPRRATAVEALAALGCYEYQACEVPAWESSEAYAACQAMRATFIRALPGYDDAPYEWTDDTVGSAPATT